MLIQNLYDEVLIKPIDQGSNELFAVSGYASATFANRHLSDKSNFKLNLIIGMPGKRTDHLGYLNLYSKFSNRFRGFYLNGSPPVHCKAYAWYNNQTPSTAFTGSANYSQPGFTSNIQLNQITSAQPNLVKNLYDTLLARCIPIEEHTFDGLSSVTSPLPRDTIQGSVTPGSLIWEIPNTRVRISLLAQRTGDLPQRSGLNWGQRPEQNREPNQAYLSLRRDARDEGFLPPLTETFTLITDDNHSFDCVVAQQGRKAIHSTLNNSELGMYFRERIGIPLGEPVMRADLEQYGRTDYTIEKLNDETFLLDFSV